MNLLEPKECEFFDLVAFKFAHGNKGTYLAKAPSWSGLRMGDNVTIRLESARPRAIVVDVMTVHKDDNEYRFVMRSMGKSEPLPRVDSKVEYRPFEYKDEEQESSNDNDRVG